VSVPLSLSPEAEAVHAFKVPEALQRLSFEVPRVLGAKPALLAWGMRDIVFRPRRFIPRMRETFHDHELKELTGAKHYIQEDAPEEIAEAIRKRFA
jgi:haloalkane dehalogenase